MAEEPGLRAQWRQFSVLLLVNAFVGAMVGLERTVMPTLAAEVFHLTAAAVVLSFIISFGVVKALANLLTGRLADRYGRKPLLVAGWCIGLPVPFVMIWAPDWSWIVAANLLLGVQQGLCWSAAVVMKIDLAGPKARGLATGLNEFTGYGAMALTTMAAGWLAATYGVRPVPFVIGIVCVLAGLLVSVLVVRETRQFAQTPSVQAGSAPLPFWHAFGRMSWGDGTLRSLSLAGLANNLNDVVVWGMLPVLALQRSVSVAEAAQIGALYLGTWGVTQLASGALSDRYGRRVFIIAGLLLQSMGIVLFAAGAWWWTVAALLMGLGTGMVYPTLLAAVGDAVGAAWRATGMGIYRFWRDSGYALGAVVAGVCLDYASAGTGIALIAAITAGAALLVWVTPSNGVSQVG